MTAPIEAIQTVRSQVVSAFAGVRQPSPEELLRSGLDARDRDSSEAVRRQFANRSWTELDADFLWGSSDHRAIFGYCYFSAEAFQYCLPPALLAALDSFDESNGNLYSVIGSQLTPSFYCLYHEIYDVGFEERRALFTADQNMAVCAFLELAFDHLPRFRWSSAKALKWGWKHIGGSGVEKVLRFYHSLYHYTYPPAPDPRAEALAIEIRQAFDPRPYPGDHQLVTTGCGDEPWEYALEFRGTDWRTLHPDFLAAQNPSLCFFSNAGFRYFLPAYMQANLCAPETVEPVIFRLTHGLSNADVRGWEELERRCQDKPADLREMFATSKRLFDEFQQNTRHIDWREKAGECFGDFTVPERQSIIHYLQYHQPQSGAFYGEMIDEALQNYWLKNSQ